MLCGEPQTFLNTPSLLQRMASYQGKIKDLEDELKKTKYNKRTQFHVGLVKAKIATLKQKETARGSGGGAGQGYSVRRSGDATVILIGFPSAGKSTILNALTNANSAVAAYEFTTLDVVPGMLKYKDSQIQILDVPGIVGGAASGRGRGKEVLACIINADLVIIVVDVTRPEALEVIQKEIYDAQVRLNQRKPDVIIKKTAKGGISVGKTVRLTQLDDETIKAILKEFRINNAEVVIRTDITADQFIDVIEGNKKYIPGFVLLNKIDLITSERLEQLKQQITPDICISADRKIYLGELRDMIFDKLQFIRVYCKEISKKADLNVPLILRRGSTLRTLCERLHKDFVKRFKYARVWGTSVKFPGQKLMKLDHKLLDKDVVELHI